MWREQEERDLALAWHAALFARQERLPPLSQVLGRQPAEAEAQTPVQMKAMLGVLAEMYGWPVKES